MKLRVNEGEVRQAVVEWLRMYYNIDCNKEEMSVVIEYDKLTEEDVFAGYDIEEFYKSCE